MYVSLDALELRKLPMTAYTLADSCLPDVALIILMWQCARAWDMASPKFLATAPGTPKMRTHDAATSELLRRTVCAAQPHTNDMYFATTTS